MKEANRVMQVVQTDCPNSTVQGLQAETNNSFQDRHSIAAEVASG